MEMINEKISINSELTFDFSKRTLTNKENKLYLLGMNEYRILRLMVNNPNRVITREEIYKYVWQQRGMEVEDSSLTQAVSSLRKRLGDSFKHPRFIITEPRIGYRFIGTLSSIQDEDLPVGNSTEREPPTSDRQTQHTPTQVSRTPYWSYFIASSLLILIGSLIIFDVDDSQTTLLYLAKKISLL